MAVRIRTISIHIMNKAIKKNTIITMSMAIVIMNMSIGLPAITQLLIK